MKKKIFISVISVGLVLIVILLSGCTENNSKAEEKITVDQALAAAPTVLNEEITNINPDAAIDAAIKHAGITREQAVFFGTPVLDNDDGRPHYDIKFSYNGFDYSYEVAIENGEIIKAEREADKTDNKNNTEKNDVSVTEKTTANKSNTGYISVEAAKQTALNNANVKAEEAIFLKAYYDYDDLVPHYEIKFVANGYEYEYEIRAADGTILDKDVERQRETVKITSSTNDYISADQAKSEAYQHANVKKSDIKYSKAELDSDDMVVHYDIEFVAGKYEFEYEINAETGKVIAFDKELND